MYLSAVWRVWVQLESDLLEPLTSESSFLSPCPGLFRFLWRAGQKAATFKNNAFCILSYIFCILCSCLLSSLWHIIPKAAHNFCFGSCNLLYLFVFWNLLFHSVSLGVYLVWFSSETVDVLHICNEILTIKDPDY